MADELERTRDELQAAAESADRDVMEQLESIDEGLQEIVGGDKTQDEPAHADRLAELEEKLDGLRGETDGDTERRVTNAASLIGAYRENRVEG